VAVALSHPVLPLDGTSKRAAEVAVEVEDVGLSGSCGQQGKGRKDGKWGEVHVGYMGMGSGW
jgi:hypothetical protein